MATEDQPLKIKSNTDNQDTAVLGAPPAAAPPGTLLSDRYLLIRKLSEGGFGAVYLAHDQQMHGREVVVKIQIDQRIDDPWFERKFNEEIRALSMIDHPGVVVAIDSGRTPDGKPFLVMQYVDGVTLRAVMNPEGMPLDRVAEIVKQVGHALAAAHEKGIWHRDLKPENLMLQSTTAGERVRLIDFGIATVADLKPKFETNTRVAGSMQYMAPEQSLGQPSALTDIYALGLIAYEMVTGRRPFIAENAVQLAALQREGVRVKPTDLRPSLPIASGNLILQSLEYEPYKRPQNARVFGDQLYVTLLGSTVVSEPPRITIAPPLPPPVRLDRKQRKWLILAVVAAFFIWSRVYDDSTNRPGRAKKPVVSETSADQAVELAYWDSVKDATEPELLQNYLDQYPDGRFESVAKTKLDILKRKGTSKTDSDGVDSRLAPDLADWAALKNSKDPQAYRDYIAKHPKGLFTAVAKLKLAALEKNP